MTSTKNNNINFDFISTFEGGSLNKGYVPDAAKSKSGVTIAVGFDLGARNVNDLRALNLDNALVDLLTPYLGLQGRSALRYVEQHPLIIADADATSINVSVKSVLIDLLVAKYDADAGVSFSSIPAKWQTVIASVEFQYGSVQKKCPSFWRCVIKQNWHEAIAELRDFGDRYRTRRNKEADYVEQHA
jgi:UDP-3-O-acyl-N-acetylglucosamine deacetylase